MQSSWAVGWAGAALAYWGVYAVVPPELGWKILFWIGILPALVILYVRRNVEESWVFVASRQAPPPQARGLLAIFAPSLLRTTILASLLCSGMLAAYYSVTTWLPTYLKTERHLSVQGTSGYLLVLIAGSFCGYLTSAWLSDLLGRRRCFVAFAVAGMLLIVAYTRLPITDAEMLLLGFPLGFFLSGIFAGVGGLSRGAVPQCGARLGTGFLLQLRTFDQCAVSRTDRCLERACPVGQPHLQHDRRCLRARDRGGVGAAGDTGSRARDHRSHFSRLM